MSRHTNDRPIKDAVNELLRKYQLDDKLKQVRLLEAWGTLMGPAVAHRTSELKIIDRKLFVTLLSASLRQELFQDRVKIIQLLNDAAGDGVIDDVIFR